MGNVDLFPQIIYFSTLNTLVVFIQMSRPCKGGCALEEELEGEDMGVFHSRLERIGRHWSRGPVVPEARRGKARTRGPPREG